MRKPSRKFGNASVRTNLAEHQFRYRYEVPAKVLADQFEHLEDGESDDGFFCYLGHWYHVSDFMFSHDANANGWQGYASDSFFSGVVIRISPDGESYIVGTYIS
jgi:hypothetical protein